MAEVKVLYGGDATSKETLSIGDVLSTKLLSEAVTLLLKKQKYMNYFVDGHFPQMYKIKIPTDQIKNLNMGDCPMLFYRFFAQVPIFQYVCDFNIQETVVSSGTKFVRIFTSKE